MGKLQPQIPQDQLVSKSQINYRIAQSYYRQRRDNFYRFMRQKAVNATKFELDLEKSIEEIWNKKIFNVMSKIYWGGKKNNVSANELEIQVRKSFQLSEKIMDKLAHAIKQGNPQTFYAGLGNAFEDWLAEEGIEPIISQMQEFANLHEENLIQTFVSGAKTSTSAVTSGIKNIRSDLIMSTYVDEDFKRDSSGVLRTPKGNLPMELQSKMNIDWENLNPDTLISDRSVLKEFLRPGQGDVFGFSAKSWTNSDGKEFMQSSVLQKMLNATFNQTDSKGKRHSWESAYTMSYVTYFLSHKIFEIIGPTTVALLSRKGITWMDDFLSTHIFYMQVQLERYWKNKDGGLGRFYPQITNPGIYVRNYNIGKVSTIAAKEHRTKRYGHYIDLKIN